ncbi:LysR family transcriptional regulator [Halomonas sp. HG01]|uniref:LysR family transcriptional regulator n=1 Tax=Halomonas sp. HG01 TaxID=1609967 RepID=UPI0009E564B1|nr:LysR family transcriptional regulator [Halomonas sp. HG01]
MLDIKYYILIEAIYKHGTLQSAAAALGLTQPAVTHRIREMERRLAISIFEKRGRKIQLTPAGVRLLETAQDIIPKIREAEGEAALLARSGTTSLKWGVDAYDTVSDILCEQHRSGVIPLELYRFSSAALTTALLDKQIDLALLTAPPEQQGINSIFLFEDELMAVLPATHHLAEKDFITAAEIAAETYLTYSATREPGFEFDLFLQPNNQSPNNIHIIESVQTILSVIADTQNGVSILSSWAIKSGKNQEGLKILPLDGDPINIRWYLTCRDNDLVNERFGEVKKIFGIISNK